jgi:hypothetical protein
MKLVQRQELRGDLLRELAPRLERLPRQLLLQRPVRLDPDVPWRRIPKLTQPRGHGGRTRRTPPSLQHERPTGFVEPALGADLPACVAVLEAQAGRAQAVFRSGSPGLRRRWIRLPSLTISST